MLSPLAVNSTSTSTAAAAAGGISPYAILELAMILVVVVVGAVVVLRGGKNRVLLLDRVRPYIWQVIIGKWDPDKRKIKWGRKKEIEVPKNQDLDVVKPPSKFRYLAIRVKGHFVELEDKDPAEGQPTNQKAKMASSPLIDPEDLPQDEERKSLIAMLTLKVPKADLIFYLLIGVGMGVFMGLFFGNFYHPGYVQAPPAGYEYQLHAITNSTTTTTTNTSGIFSTPFPNGG